MQLYEELMGRFPELTYKYDPMMPKCQKGWIHNETVYLNPNQKYKELNSTVAEEIGHYLTGSGNIVHQNSNEKRKQERKARDIGAILIVTPQSIIECFEAGCISVWECAEHLQVTEQTFKDAIRYYARKYDKYNGLKTEDKHILIFKTDGTVGVYRSL